MTGRKPLVISLRKETYRLNLRQTTCSKWITFALGFLFRRWERAAESSKLAMVSLECFHKDLLLLGFLEWGDGLG